MAVTNINPSPAVLSPGAPAPLGALLAEMIVLLTEFQKNGKFTAEEAARLESLATQLQSQLGGLDASLANLAGATDTLNTQVVQELVIFAENLATLSQLSLCLFGKGGEKVCEDIPDIVGKVNILIASVEKLSNTLDSKGKPLLQFLLDLDDEKYQRFHVVLTDFIELGERINQTEFAATLSANPTQFDATATIGIRDGFENRWRFGSQVGGVSIHSTLLFPILPNMAQELGSETWKVNAHGGFGPSYFLVFDESTPNQYGANVGLTTSLRRDFPDDARWWQRWQLGAEMGATTLYNPETDRVDPDFTTRLTLDILLQGGFGLYGSCKTEGNTSACLVGVSGVTELKRVKRLPLPNLK